MDSEIRKLHTFDLEEFKKRTEGMIDKNTSTYSSDWLRGESWRSYTLEEVLTTLDKGTVDSRIKLSQHFFKAEGFYRNIILYYAGLLQYKALVVPKFKNPTKPAKKVEKNYYEVMDFCENHYLSDLCYDFARSVLVNGSYAGVITILNRKDFAVVQIPYPYYRSKFKDVYGRDVVEFNLSYFDKLDEYERTLALDAYPAFIRKSYNKFKKGKIPAWVILPPDLGFYFAFTDDAIPLFLNVIPAIFHYDMAIETEREREIDGISKILVQHIPHLNTGELLFEPPEVQVMHDAAVGMMSKTKGVSVLTTYGEVSAIGSKATSEGIDDALEKIYENIYIQAGVSPSMFSPTESSGVDYAIKKDIALMMILANQFSRVFSYILDATFSNSNVSFEYKILPLSFYNQKQFLDDSLNLAKAGFSFLLPSIAMGIDQHEILNLKVLENDILELREYLVPLQTSYTLSAEDSKNEKEKEENNPPDNQEDPTIENPEDQKSEEDDTKEDKKLETQVEEEDE